MFIETGNSLNEGISPTLYVWTLDNYVENKIQISSCFRICRCIQSDLGLAVGLVTENSVVVDQPLL
jgi:hypothetical protein